MSVMIDVREKDEFLAERAPDVVHLPLSEFSHMAPGILQCLKDKDIIFMCRGGNRAKLALDQARQLGFGDVHRFSVYEGGMIAWKAAGKKVVTGAVKAVLPIMRQVQLVAGALVLMGVLAGFLIAPVFFWVAGFVGAGLTFAGATGFCGMAVLLKQMPWNQQKKALACAANVPQDHKS